MTNQTQQHADAIVVGGGLSGLAAAAYLGRAGLSVTLFERSSQPGGRAMTQEQGGFHFNLGPHALYQTGPAAAVLGELGVRYEGGEPPTSGAALKEGNIHKLPADPWSLLTTGLFGLGDKIEAGRVLATVQRIDTDALQGVSVRAWLDANLRRPNVRQLIAAVVRLTSYTNDPERMSAGVALRQAQLGLKGVRYLDGGWQTLVDGLRSAAEQAGVHIVTGARVMAVENAEAVRGVRLEDGATHPTESVIIAASPAIAASLIEGSAGNSLRAWSEAATPVKAATLDVGLSRLPRPEARFALGIDQPLYLSVHSGVARLAPEGGALVHVLKYLPAGELADATEVERELEGLLDLMQPGWRDAAVERRFLPDLTVVNALTPAAEGGLAGRPEAEVQDVRGLYLAGDWVGGEGWLSDASLASAKRAAELVIRSRGRARETSGPVAAGTGNEHT